MESPVLKQKGMAKVAIVGVGAVGSTLAYALMLQGLAREMVLIDLDVERAKGEAMDLSHGLPFVRRVEIWAGDYGDCREADIVVISAGGARRLGKSRLELTESNAAILREAIPQVCRYNEEGILLVITNPVDVMTYLTLKLSGREPSKVLGSGTLLDSARFRFLLSGHCGVDPRNVHAYIIGEHGDSALPVWSKANIAGMRLDDYCLICQRACPPEVKEGLFEQVRQGGYEVVRRKGATNYAIGLATTAIMESILRDQSTVMPVSLLLEGQYGITDICLSLPAVIDRSGIARVIQLDLNEVELEGLRRSAQILKEAAASVGW